MPLVFLTKADVLTRIKEKDLDAITESDDSKLDEPEADALLEFSSYISTRYDYAAILALETKPAIIKRIIIDILLYNLHTRVNPKLIPEKRIELRDDAISWLKLVASPRSNVNADFLPLRDYGEKRGTDISWGSRKKRNNHY